MIFNWQDSTCEVVKCIYKMNIEKKYPTSFDIADNCGYSVKSVNGIVTLLQKHGLTIREETIKEKERIKIIKITEYGYEVFEKMLKNA